MALDLTAFSKVDAGSKLSATTTTETFTGLNTADTAYAYNDYGTGFFAGNAYFEGTLNISASNNSSTIAIGYGSALGTWNADSDTAGILLQNPGFGSALTPYVDLKTAGVESDGTPANLVNGTTYYYRCGFLAALGQYGGLYLWIYSDSGRTTLVTSAINLRTVATAYRYFYPIRSLGSGTGAQSGTNANITLFNPAAGLVLTSCTEVDPSSHLTQYADCSVVNTLNTNETAYLYKDYTAGNIAGNYTFQTTLNLTAFASGAAGQMFNLLSCVNTLGHANNTNNLQGVAVNWVSSTTFSLKAREVSGATEYLSSASSTLDVGVPVFVQINRDTSVGTYGTLYVKVFSDPAYTIQIGSTVSLTLHNNGTPTVAAFRYLNVIQSYNTGTSRSSTLTLGTVNVTIAAPPNTVALSFTQDANVVAITGAVRFPTLTSLTFTQADNIVAITGSKFGRYLQAIFTQADNVVAATASYKFKGTVGFTQDSNAISIGAALATVAEPFSVRIRHKTTGAPLTGLTTVTLTAEQPYTGYRLDFADGSFKATPGTPTLILSEVSSANQPGLYRSNVMTTIFQGWVNYEVTYNDGSYVYSFPGESYYTAGQRVNGTWSLVQQNQIAALQSSISTLSTGLTPPTAASVADAVWSKQVTDMTVSGSIGQWVTTKVLTAAKFLGLK